MASCNGEATAVATPALTPESLVFRDLIAGTAGGMLGMLAGHPLDTAKTRLQAMPRFDGSTTWRVVADTARVEGTRSLYRGLSMPLATACLINAIVFAVQGASERGFVTVFGADRTQLCGFLGGCVAGFAQSPIVTLAELVKCQRQVQFVASCCPHAPGPLTLLYRRVMALGVRQGCMQGLGATVVRECPSYGVYFVVYEEAKAASESLKLGSVPATLLSGGFAGCVSLGMVHPVDVVKSKIQALPIDAPAAQRSAMQAARAGLDREGLPFFLRGFSASMQRAFVINSATFGGYELAVNALKGW